MALYIPVYIIKGIKWQTAQNVWLYYRLLYTFVHPFKNLGLRCQKTFRVKNKCISFSEIMGKVDNRVKQQIASLRKKGHTMRSIDCSVFGNFVITLIHYAVHHQCTTFQGSSHLPSQRLLLVESLRPRR
jgi:hypothetical protein